YVWTTTAILLLFQGLFTYLPVMHTLFGTAGLDAATWGRILLFGLALFLVVEFEKGLLARRT
ncbi:MAG: cation transporting ATPase C-terminal domain-containing protein, partial [Gallionellaceae bacterium]|nr:cation transporting ATPase C-terminal domain-containing protein [Gallionellaceae bacterium]